MNALLATLLLSVVPSDTLPAPPNRVDCVEENQFIDECGFAHTKIIFWWRRPGDVWEVRDFCFREQLGEQRCDALGVHHIWFTWGECRYYVTTRCRYVTSTLGDVEEMEDRVLSRDRRWLLVPDE